MGQQIYDSGSTNSGNWLVPPDVTIVDVLLISGGGGGGEFNGGGGGGGGASKRVTGYAVTPGANISWNRGSGGGASSGGTYSTFDGFALFVGGASGGSGSGGSGSGATGDFNGGNGGSGVGGSGGGAAGLTAGSNGGAGTGSAVPGGAGGTLGGNGGAGGFNGSNGSYPGGGGGGAAGGTAGSGAGGYIQIDWEDPPDAAVRTAEGGVIQSLDQVVGVAGVIVGAEENNQVQADITTGSATSAIVVVGFLGGGEQDSSLSSTAALETVAVSQAQQSDNLVTGTAAYELNFRFTVFQDADQQAGSTGVIVGATAGQQQENDQSAGSTTSTIAISGAMTASDDTQSGTSSWPNFATGTLTELDDTESATAATLVLSAGTTHRDSDELAANAGVVVGTTTRPFQASDLVTGWLTSERFATSDQTAASDKASGTATVASVLNGDISERSNRLSGASKARVQLSAASAIGENQLNARARAIVVGVGAVSQKSDLVTGVVGATYISGALRFNSDYLTASGIVAIQHNGYLIQSNAATIGSTSNSIAVSASQHSQADRLRGEADCQIAVTGQSSADSNRAIGTSRGANRITATIDQYAILTTGTANIGIGTSGDHDQQRDTHSAGCTGAIAGSGVLIQQAHRSAGGVSVSIVSSLAGLSGFDRLVSSATTESQCAANIRQANQSVSGTLAVQSIATGKLNQFGDRVSGSSTASLSGSIFRSRIFHSPAVKRVLGSC